MYSADIRMFLERELAGVMADFDASEPGSVAWHELAVRVRDLRRLIADQELEAGRAEMAEVGSGRGTPVG